MTEKSKFSSVRDNDLGVWRGLVFGIILGTAMWGAVIGLIWWWLIGS